MRGSDKMMQRAGRWASTWAVALGALLVGGGGCEKADTESCAYWTDRLANSGAIDVALKRVGDLKCGEALPVLQQMFEQELLLESVLHAVKQIGKPEASAPLLRAAMLKPLTTRQATSLAQEWHLAAVEPELVRILTDPALAEARDVALPALLALGDAKKYEDLLIGLVLGNLDKQPMEINRDAIRELGKMRSQKAVPTLVKAIFLRSVKGQEVYRDVRHALAEIGDASVVTELLSVLAGTNEAVNTYTAELGLLPWEVSSTPKVVQVLADTLDPRIIEPFLADLSADIQPPAEASDRDFDRWGTDKTNRMKVISLALGHLGSDTGVAALGRLVRDTYKDTFRQRLNAASALAAIGSEAAQDVLLSAWSDEILEILRAAMLSSVAQAVDDRRLAVWDELLGIVPEGARPPKKPVELSQALTEALAENEYVRTYIAVARKCAGDLACWLEKAQSQDQNEQVKALLVLARGRFEASDAIKAAFWEALEKAPKELSDTRRYALMGITRMGNPVDGARLVKLGEATLKSDPYWGEEYFALGRGLETRMAR